MTSFQYLCTIHQIYVYSLYNKWKVHFVFKQKPISVFIMPFRRWTLRPITGVHISIKHVLVNTLHRRILHRGTNRMIIEVMQL